MQPALRADSAGLEVKEVTRKNRTPVLKDVDELTGNDHVTLCELPDRNTGIQL